MDWLRYFIQYFYRFLTQYTHFSLKFGARLKLNEKHNTQIISSTTMRKFRMDSLVSKFKLCILKVMINFVLKYKKEKKYKNRKQFFVTKYISYLKVCI